MISKFLHHEADLQSRTGTKHSTASAADSALSGFLATNERHQEILGHGIGDLDFLNADKIFKEREEISSLSS